MEPLGLRTDAAPLVNPADTSYGSVGKQTAWFVAIAFGMSWGIWITAICLGAHPGKGEEILAFGVTGPVMAAIFLSRSGRKERRIGIAARSIWFALLWAPCWAIYILSDKMRGVTPNPSLSFCLIVAALAAIPAWLGSGAVSSDTGVWAFLQTLVIPQNWRWHAVALLSLPAILVIPAMILHALGRPVVPRQTSVSIGPWIAYGTLMFFRGLFFTAYFEEPGWRGYLLPRLQRKFSPLVASLIVWLPWALWHAPLDYDGPVGRHLMGYLQTRVVSLILCSIILTWLYNRSGGNVLTVAIFHAGMNTFPLVLPYSPISLVLFFFWVVYAIVADKMWRQDSLPARAEAAIPEGSRV